MLVPTVPFLTSCPYLMMIGIVHDDGILTGQDARQVDIELGRTMQRQAARTGKLQYGQPPCEIVSQQGVIRQ